MRELDQEPRMLVVAHVPFHGQVCSVLGCLLGAFNRGWCEFLLSLFCVWKLIVSHDGGGWR